MYQIKMYVYSVVSHTHKLHVNEFWRIDLAVRSSHPQVAAQEQKE